MATVNDLKIMVEEMRDKMATNEQVQKFIDLIAAKDAKILELERRITSLEESKDLVERKLDDLESYGRRQNLRIVGIPVPGGAKETADDVNNAVKTELDKLKIPNFNFNRDVVRAHRVGKKSKDKNGRVIHPVIVRFSSWKSRTLAYRKREKRGEVSYYPDLTKRRLELKKKAEEKVKGNKNISYVFADVNNNIGLKLENGRLAFFNSVHELDRIIEQL